MKNILTELKWRNLLKTTTDDSLFFNNKQSIYCGFDPTAKSLHIGNLLLIKTLKHFIEYGFTVIVIIGQATALIGDPSDKTKERETQLFTTVAKNTFFLIKQIQKIIPQAKIINNFDWWDKVSIIDYLRENGKFFKIGNLIKKDVIAKRIKSGLSFTEFSYILLQSYDFFHLYQKFNCHLQLGGSDQWGNIVSGINLIKNRQKQQQLKIGGIVINLLLDKTGNKIGKSNNEQNIWLDPLLTSPYDLYNFFYQHATKKMLAMFTFLPQQTIEQIPEQSVELQKTLAGEVLSWVYNTKTKNEIMEVKKIISVPRPVINLQTIKILDKILNQVLFKFKLTIATNLIANNIFKSKREIKEFINDRSLKINGGTLTDINGFMQDYKALFNNYYLVKKGKKGIFLIKLI